MGAQAVSRRDVLKVSALGAAAMALPFERTARAKTASRIASSKIPKPYTLPFAAPPVIDGRGGGTLDDHPEDGQHPDPPWRPDPDLRLQRHRARTDDPRPAGHPAPRRHDNELPARHPQWGYEAWTSVPPARVGLAAAVRRLRQRHHAPGQNKNYQYPNYQAARTLWYHDHGVHHTAENAYMGLAAQYQLQRRRSRTALPIPQGRLRRAADRSRTRCSPPTASSCTTTRATPGSTAT